MVKVLKCTCEHQFQDKEYGKGNRLCNQTIKSNGIVFRCTVCGKEK